MEFAKLISLFIRGLSDYKLALGVMVTGFIFAGVIGFDSATETYQNVYSIDCSKTVPTAWYKNDFPSRGSLPNTMVKCGYTFYLKDAYETKDKFGNLTKDWTGIYKR
ncbi:hypothetical protein SPE26_24770 [Bacillus thuringiensis]|uniref:ABC transporter permease n=1 Tax=Bacillus thuringiensis TaxID=1428 RepID=A0AAW9GF79_BACTU|nr:hypothetical protein [Bacillus thuringiensis]MDY0853935.1 hypothetical protein [Bacillus thuringiensis]MDY4393898.1 hypothetical protein [Bacillus thuringiensis]MDY7962607.1 hypothetical protein [Bacillus thuringiensis]